MNRAVDMIRILLLEDHTAFRQALAMALSFRPNICVVGDAGTVAEARTRLKGVDVAVFDLDLPDGDGSDLIRELHVQSPGARALVLTASSGRRDLSRTVAAGAAAVLHKSTPITEIVDAIHRVNAGAALISHIELTQLVQEGSAQRETDRAARAGFTRLTIREREVLQLLAEGLSDKEIAARLRVGVETVKSHVAGIYGKLEVESRVQALMAAVRLGAVTLD